MATALYLRNVSDEDFIGQWDSVDYKVKAGESVLLQSHIAIHLAKHLAMREIGRANVNAVINNHVDENGRFTNELFRSEVEKYISEDEISAETPEKLEIAMIVEKKKAGRPKKEVVEEEFADLKVK